MLTGGTHQEKKKIWGRIFTKVKMRSKCPQKSDASDVFHMEKAFFLTLSLFCSSRLLFSPNQNLTALYGNRFHSLQNKWKHSICGPRDNYPCLRSLAPMLQTTCHHPWPWTTVANEDISTLLLKAILSCISGF